MKPLAGNTTLTIPAAYILPAALIVLTLTNGFFNSMATAFGAAFPYDTFCFSANDLFADFIKAAVSYPGPEIFAVSTICRRFTAIMSPIILMAARRHWPKAN